MALKIWKKLTSKTLFKNPYWEYNLDTFQIDDKKSGEYYYVNSPGSTLVIPITNNKTILLVKQFRYLVNKICLEFPCGAVSGDMLPEENAQKELREETGYKANKLVYMGAFVPYNGVSNEVCYVYAGLNLKHAPLPCDETEEMELVEMRVSEMEHALKLDEIQDGMTLAAWMLSKEKIMKLLS